MNLAEKLILENQVQIMRALRMSSVNIPWVQERLDERIKDTEDFLAETDVEE